jgi:hypothetical protein
MPGDKVQELLGLHLWSQEPALAFLGTVGPFLGVNMLPGTIPVFLGIGQMLPGTPELFLGVF